MREGGEDGPRRAEGRGRGEGGKEKRANVGLTRFLWSLVIDENVCVSLQQYFRSPRKAVFLVEGVFTGGQQSTVKPAAPGA